MRVEVKLKMKPIKQIVNDKGLADGGAVQRFHTSNVLRRITKYMPYRTGALIKQTIAQTDIRKRYIVSNSPCDKYLYYGKAMEGPAPKTVTDRPLNYTKTKNPLAGPKWDEALVAAEGAALTADLQKYIKSLEGK